MGGCRQWHDFHVMLSRTTVLFDRNLFLFAQTCFCPSPFREQTSWFRATLLFEKESPSSCQEDIVSLRSDIPGVFASTNRSWLAASSSNGSACVPVSVKVQEITLNQEQDTQDYACWAEKESSPGKERLLAHMRSAQFMWHRSSCWSLLSFSLVFSSWCLHRGNCSSPFLLILLSVIVVGLPCFSLLSCYSSVFSPSCCFLLQFAVCSRRSVSFLPPHGLRRRRRSCWAERNGERRNGRRKPDVGKCRLLLFVAIAASLNFVDLSSPSCFFFWILLLFFLILSPSISCGWLLFYFASQVRTARHSCTPLTLAAKTNMEAQHEEIQEERAWRQILTHLSHLEHCLVICLTTFPTRIRTFCADQESIASHCLKIMMDHETWLFFCALFSLSSLSPCDCYVHALSWNDNLHHH